MFSYGPSLRSPGSKMFETSMIWLERASSTGRFCLGPGRALKSELSRAEIFVANGQPPAFGRGGEPGEGALHVGEELDVAARIVRGRLSADPEQAERLAALVQPLVRLEDLFRRELRGERRVVDEAEKPAHDETRGHGGHAPRYARLVEKERKAVAHQHAAHTTRSSKPGSSPKPVEHGDARRTPSCASLLGVKDVERRPTGRAGAERDRPRAPPATKNKLPPPGAHERAGPREVVFELEIGAVLALRARRRRRRSRRCRSAPR